MHSASASLMVSAEHLIRKPPTLTVTVGWCINALLIFHPPVLKGAVQGGTVKHSTVVQFTVQIEGFWDIAHL